MRWLRKQPRSREVRRPGRSEDRTLLSLHRPEDLHRTASNSPLPSAIPKKWACNCISGPQDAPGPNKRKLLYFGAAWYSNYFTKERTRPFERSTEQELYFNKQKFRAHVVRVVLMQRAGMRPGASGCRVQVPGDVPGLEYALRAFWRCQPRRNWFSLGLSAHHLCIDAWNTERTLTAAAGPSPRDPYRHAL